MKIGGSLMHLEKFFSTADFSAGKRFEAWCDVVARHVVPLEVVKLGDHPFKGSVAGADLGALTLTHAAGTATRTTLTREAIRLSDKANSVSFAIMQAGSMIVKQNDKEAVLSAGDMALLDHSPTTTLSSNDSEALYINIPAKKFESFLGPTKVYSALTMGLNLASGRLVSSYFRELAYARQSLPPETLKRVASIGIDLIIASISERLAQTTPKPLYGTLIIQRAIAYIEENLGDPNLDPTQLAAAVGVSLRRLQQLFQERNRSISDWISQRRLEVATQRLADPSYAYRSIGEIAYSCGFVNQAHFTRRFKDHHGLTPRDFRWRALVKP